MTRSVATRPSLLVRLRDPHDGASWREFVALYAPVMYRFARRQGLQDADAADVAQEVLQAVHGAIGRFDYDPERGTFRGWLLTLAHRKLCDFFRRQGRQPVGSGDDGVDARLHDLPAPQTDLWEAEYQRQLLVLALRQAKAIFGNDTWAAFERTALGERAPADVARELGMSLGSVYVARSRVQARLKQLVREADAQE